ncbi:MAG: PRC-barrel domain-containing protein [Chloroflexota bacterium]|nr:PRC-barrel domain-containing protein [Chloroflexota bacterium]MDQ6906738.1 PRC-barrel domain-containing protein [Chloroflexota bacterium]
MVTESRRPITELIEPPLMAVDMRVPSMVVLRRLEQEGNHMAIITDEGKPIGMISLAAAREEASEEKLVGQLTVEPLPMVLPDSATVDDAIHMNTANMDRVPVVNADGVLIGELPRTKIAATGLHQGDEVPVVAEREGMEMPITVKVGQTVVGADGGHIGTVKDVVVEVNTGRVGHIVVEEGLLFKKERKIPVDLIDPMADDDHVHLKVDKADVDRLGDMHAR